MSHHSDLIATDINAYLAQHEKKELLRFLTCGSVDDGKSTLIGRLLYDSKMVYEDQIAAIEKDTVRYGTTNDKFDMALLMDGLKDEREQGITIDVSYRYFSTAKRKFIIADTPGHVQYTRNMATGASTADLAIILVDARHGVLEQTRRHSFIVELLGIRHVLVAVNKMDLVDFSEERYEEIRTEYKEFAQRLDIPDLHFIPLSALNGDNVVDRSDASPWYSGPTLMEFLESVYTGSDRNLQDFRFPVQFVNRPHLDFRGFCGTIASGIIRKGDEIMTLPSKKKSKVKSIITFEGEVDEAFTPQAVTLTLEDEIDISRGDMIVRPGNVPKVERKFEATLVWMNEKPLTPGTQYLFKQSTRTSPGSISTLRYQIDVNTLHRQPAATLGLNQIGRVAVSLNVPLAFDGYRRNKSTGSFIVVDRITNATVAAGMIMDTSTSETGSAHWSDEPASKAVAQTSSSVTAEERNARFGQKPVTILLTGLSGAGKSTTAAMLERKLFDAGRAASVLDGQKLRRGMSRDLGFTADERSENLRRGAEVAKIMNEAGLICIAAFMAPVEDVRQKAKSVVGDDSFLVVYLKAPVEVCRQRDKEGLYGAADAGEIGNFPGVTARYEEPENADLILETDKTSPEDCVEKIWQLLESKGVVE